MAKRKYRFEKMSQEQLEQLAEKFPKAVRSVTTRRPVYTIIAQLLNCGVEVPGVVLVDDEKAQEDESVVHTATNAPAFLTGKKAKA